MQTLRWQNDGAMMLVPFKLDGREKRGTVIPRNNRCRGTKKFHTLKKGSLYYQYRDSEKR